MSKIIKFKAKNSLFIEIVPPKGSIFFKGGHPSHDYHGKTIADIEKWFFAFNCQLKKLDVEIL